jgi:heavy metal sensor kinase
MKNWKINSLTLRLTIWYLVILGFMISFVGIFLYRDHRENLYEQLDESLREAALDVDRSRRETRREPWNHSIVEIEAQSRHLQLYIQVAEFEEGSYSTRMKDFHHSVRTPENAFRLEGEIYEEAERVGRIGEDLVVLDITERQVSQVPFRILLLEGRGPYIIQVAASLQPIFANSRQYMMVLILSGSVLLLFATLGGMFIIRQALKPVRSVVRTAQRITADDLTLRIEERARNDEIGELVGTFNNMISRLEKSVSRIREFSGDASHELRTPLTIIRGEIEVLLRKERSRQEYQQALESVLEEAGHLEQIIDNLLFLSRVDAQRKRELEDEVPLGEIVLSTCEKLEPIALQKNIGISLEGVSPLVVLGERALLERLVFNVVKNAIRFTQTGGTVELQLTSRDSHVSLIVQDTGIGIPEEALPSIFDRFYVVDRSRSKEYGGNGLGLAIVKWVAEIHQARIEVSSVVGEGSTFTFLFPLRQHRLP